MAPDILARQDDAVPGKVEAGGMDRPGFAVQGCCLERSFTERTISAASRVRVEVATEATERIASSIDSMPHRPQPTGPASLRRLASKRLLALSFSRIWISMPSPRSCTSIAAISSGEETMPSVSEKPSAKSSRSAGEAIITACVVPA